MSATANKVSKCFIHFGAFSNEDILIRVTRISLCKIFECRTRDVGGKFAFGGAQISTGTFLETRALFVASIFVC